jgi:DNA polymerase III subunit delta'
MPFRDIVGHVRLIDLLTRSIAGGTLPPSLLFSGPSGIGKRLTAVAAAQTLNCLEPRPATDGRRPASDDGRPATDDRRLSTVDACGRCAACRRIARGVHPDVMIIEPGDSGAIKIDQVRDIVDRAGYRPSERRRRVVIIDDADALVPAAQNALLKTLEEPPSLSMFVLVTARPDVLLPTVRSRCPQLRFQPLSASEIAKALVTRGSSESEAQAVAATADGSLGQALAARGGELVESRDVAHRVLVQASATTDAGRRLEGAKELLSKTGAGGAGDREQLASHLRAMASLVRDVEVLATCADVRMLANPDVQSALERLTPVFEGERGIRAFTAIDRALVALERNAGVKVVADWLVLQL